MTSEKSRSDFESVVLPHLDEAYNLARWLMRSAPEAQDVVQDAVLRALTYFETFRGTNAKAWVLTIVRNAAYSALRKQNEAGAVLPLDDEDAAESDGRFPPIAALIDATADPESLLAKAQERERFDELLAALPIALRECIVLRDIEGLAYKEISAIIGAPIGTVMSRLWRARRTLTKLASESVR